MALTLPPEPAGSLIFSGLMSFITQTAAITSFTPPGGFFIDLTMVISVGFKVSKAATSTKQYHMEVLF